MQASLLGGGNLHVTVQATGFIWYSGVRLPTTIVEYGLLYHAVLHRVSVSADRTNTTNIGMVRAVQSLIGIMPIYRTEARKTWACSTMPALDGLPDKYRHRP